MALTEAALPLWEAQGSHAATNSREEAGGGPFAAEAAALLTGVCAGERLQPMKRMRVAREKEV